MTVMENWDSIYGHKSLRWGGDRGGLLTDKALWSLQVPEGLTLGKIVFRGDRCFALDGDRSVHAIDTETGTIEWSSKPVTLQQRVTHLNALDDYLVVEFIVLDTDSGEAVADLREQLGGLPLKTGTPMETFGNVLFKVIDAKAEPGKVLRFDIDKPEASVLQTGAVNLIMPDEELIVGWREVDGRMLLSRYSVPGDMAEVLSDKVEIGRLLLSNDRLLVVNQNHLALVDVGSGELDWRMETVNALPDIDPKKAAGCHFAISDDLICATYTNRLVAIDREQGKLIWHRDFPQLKDYCLLGDLIYTSHGRGVLTALDGFSGETAWSNETGFPWDSVKAHTDKVFYLTYTGVLACYQWDVSSPYQSSARSS